MSALPERFTSKYTVDPETGCWVWTGARNAKGYGNIQGRMAHRVIYELVHGVSLPPELDAHHTCYNRACVRPDHIRPVSHAENIRDAVNRLAGVPDADPREPCPLFVCGHPRTPENTVKNGGPNGRCRECHLAKCRARYVPRPRVPRVLPPEYPCGHPRTPENTVRNGAGSGRCRDCNRERIALHNAVASALGKSWGVPVMEARKNPRVKAIVRNAWNWTPASDAEAEELANVVDAVERIESGRPLTKKQKIAAT